MIEIRAPDGPVEHRSAGEHRLRMPISLDHEGKVVQRMTASRHRADGQLPDRHDVAWRHRPAIECDRLGRGDAVARPNVAREGESTAHVVVMDVRLEHQIDGQSGALDRRHHAIDVPLGIDHHGVGTVMHDVTAVPEFRGLDGFDVQPRECSVVIRMSVHYNVLRVDTRPRSDEPPSTVGPAGGGAAPPDGNGRPGGPASPRTSTRR